MQEISLHEKTIPQKNLSVLGVKTLCHKAPKIFWTKEKVKNVQNFSKILQNFTVIFSSSDLLSNHPRWARQRPKASPPSLGRSPCGGIPKGGGRAPLRVQNFLNFEPTNAIKNCRKFDFSTKKRNKFTHKFISFGSWNILTQSAKLLEAYKGLSNFWSMFWQKLDTFATEGDREKTRCSTKVLTQITEKNLMGEFGAKRQKFWEDTKIMSTFEVFFNR